MKMSRIIINYCKANNIPYKNIKLKKVNQKDIIGLPSIKT